MSFGSNILEHRNIAQELNADDTCRHDSKNLKNLFPQIAAALIAALFHFIAGISFSFRYFFKFRVEQGDSSDFQITEYQLLWIVNAFYISISIGGIVSGFLVEAVGRVNTIKLSLICSLIGWFTIGFAQSATTLIIGRLITGFANVCGICSTSVYITEIARFDVRGSLLSLGPLLFSLGRTLSQRLRWVIDWRIIAGFTISCKVIVFFLILLIPESPVWLISKGRIEEARMALNWFQSQGKNKTVIQAQNEDLIKEHDEKENRKSKWKPVAIVRNFLKPTGYKPLMILLVLFVFKQASEIYTYSFTTIFRKTGYNLSLETYFWLVHGVEITVSVINIISLKFINRRTLVICGFVAVTMGAFSFGLDAYAIGRGGSVPSWIPSMAAMLLIRATLSASIFTVPFTMIAEMFPTEIRGMAFCVIYAIEVGFFYSIVGLSFVIFPHWLLAINRSTAVHWIFIAISLTGLVYTYIFLPETHNVELSNIQIYFEKGNFRWAQMRKSLERRNEEGSDEVLMREVSS